MDSRTQKVYCKNAKKYVNIESNLQVLNNGNGDDSKIFRKYCSESNCNQMGICEHTKIQGSF
jgi:hypothetical protein